MDAGSANLFVSNGSLKEKLNVSTTCRVRCQSVNIVTKKGLFEYKPSMNHTHVFVGFVAGSPSSRTSAGVQKG